MTQQSSQSSIDPRHLVVVGAGPGVGAAIARRFGRDGFHLTLLSRGAAALAAVAADVRRTGAHVDQIVADPAQPEQLRATLSTLYGSAGAPGLLIYNASILAPDSLLTVEVAHLHEAYDVDVVGAIVATQIAAAAMRAAGGGTILFTGGGFADYPVKELATVSLGKAALRSAATMLSADLADQGIRLASLTIAGQVKAGTAFDGDRIADAYWNIVTGPAGEWKSEYRFEG
jgi:short-subunit dehydrogenase